jgi:RNA polymerase sigma-70 factor (ECF subfamily)
MCGGARRNFFVVYFAIFKKNATPYNVSSTPRPLSFKDLLRYNLEMKESQLIDACLANNRLAQRQLYDQYKRAMFTLAFRITGDYELAAEALQDAFLNVFRYLGDFEGKSTLGAWIKTIVIRTAVRKSERRHKSFDDLHGVPETGELDWGTRALDAEYLEKAIQSLPEGYREIFVLAEIEGYKHHEIGEMLGISEGTSRSQLFHAKKRLREMLIAQ